jgi:ABC-type uncharacterized transport system permease subunit
MLSGVGIICFASSYAVAWALEISRLLFRSGVRGAVMLGFAGAGLVAHTAFLYYRAIGEQGAPLSSEQDWFLVAAWAMVVVYLYLDMAHPMVHFGLFLLPLTLCLIGTAHFLAENEPLAREPASRLWGAVHGVSIMLAVVSVLVGFMAGLMYLGQARRLKRKQLHTGRILLPSLEWLQRATSRAIVIAVLMLGVGIVSGSILNKINVLREDARLPWNDPVILSTWLMFFWLLTATVLSAVYRPALQGRKVAYLTLASFVFLAIMLSAGLLMSSRHWGRGERGESRGERVRVRAWEQRNGLSCFCMSTRPSPPPPLPKGEGSNLQKPDIIHHSSSFIIIHPSPFTSLPSPLSPLPFFPGGRPC